MILAPGVLSPDRNALAVPFTPADSFTDLQLDLGLSRIGAVGLTNVTLRSNAAGLPSGTVLGS